ncbi:MAG: UDP-glucose/GDP-mannose dehydrogenase family protein [Lysobacterales bacterium]
MHLAIFGTGYVGLVTGACLAEMGNTVTCVDTDAGKIARIERGEMPIFEPGLEPLVRANHAAGRLRFTTDAEAAIGNAAIVFVAVGTPPDEDGSADLRHVLAVARTIGMHATAPLVVVNKSTVPVGTAERVFETINEELVRRGVGLEVTVASNPEFLKEGNAVEDCLRPDRIVLGCTDPRALELLRRLYAPFQRNHDRIVVMDVRSAELTKYAANAMLATKISFMNEIANIAEHVGADVEMVRQGIGSDSRIGYHFIYPGIGYGGSCFPKDVKALSRTAHQHGYTPQILEAVEWVNEAQKLHLFDSIARHFGATLRGRTLALWGLAFKPNTDDMREAPALVLLQQLWDAGVNVRAFDPVAQHEAARIFGARSDLTLCDSPAQALEGADGLAVITEWKEFRSPDWRAVRAAIRNPVVFDGRNLYDPVALEAEGIAHYGIGRGRAVRGPEFSGSSARAGA